MPSETLIKLTSGEESAIVATNVSGMVRHLAKLGFEPGEEEDGVKYFEVDKAFVVIRRPKQARELTDEERAARRQRLVDGKARKAAEAAAPKGKASSKSKGSTKPAPTAVAAVVEEAPAPTPPATNGKASKGSAKAATPAPTPAPEPAKSGLASRVRISR
jgi:cell division protein FtsN